jgi:glycosyltransferase involved in cell wall biosynthesis
MAEVGLDSQRNGEEVQATVLNWQLRTLFEAGCSGGFVFSWTDEWYRGGFDIEDWDFGLTTRSRSPKPALGVVKAALVEAPFPTQYNWPKISIIVCSFNGAATIHDTLEGIQHLTYPNFEAIVINDGSVDNTPEIAAKYPVKLISTENRGLSSARNTGFENATGEIVAYIDDDAYPDPHWLHYLAMAFISGNYVGVGGPNFAPPGDGLIAECVANAPGGPVHVLISDQVAEHIPGCNMAFRRTDLIAIGGFDPRYRAAGDDVDLCWRLQDRGGVIGFAPAAVVWHHRRNSIRMYWRQQQGYGKAEALLEEKWPHRYNAAGHLTWAGRLYGKGLTQALPGGKWRIYQGSWGTALFQSIYEPTVGTLRSLPLMPEWYLVTAAIALLSLFGLAWQPLLFLLPLLAIAVTAMLTQAALSGIKAKFPSQWNKRRQRLALHGITSVLHLVQPLARLIGRLRHGLTPWRERGVHKQLILWPRSIALWSETWRPADEWLHTLENKLRERKVPVIAGGNFDSWDLRVRGGLFGSAHLLMAIEEHGANKQLLRFRIWPSCHFSSLVLILLLAMLSMIAVLDRSQLVTVLLGGLALLLAWRGARECSISANVLLEVQEELDQCPSDTD